MVSSRKTETKYITSEVTYCIAENPSLPHIYAMKTKKKNTFSKIVWKKEGKILFTHNPCEHKQKKHAEKIRKGYSNVFSLRITRNDTHTRVFLHM